jgi:low affinity Fe/Cu permease
MDDPSIGQNWWIALAAALGTVIGGVIGSVATAVSKIIQTNAGVYQRIITATQERSDLIETNLRKEIETLDLKFCEMERDHNGKITILHKANEDCEKAHKECEKRSKSNSERVDALEKTVKSLQRKTS